MSDLRLHIGLTGAVHSNMPGDDAGLYASVIEQMSGLSKTMGFDLSVYHEPLHGEEDGRKAGAFMDDRKVDFTLLFNASLPFGRMVLPLARVHISSETILTSTTYPSNGSTAARSLGCSWSASA